jgi:hypothetical protein
MTRTPFITSLLAAALLAGCGAENADRAGGEKPVKAKVLTMANANFDLGELEEKVLGDGLVAPMLESLGEFDLRGIGVLPGPLRRPLGKHPLRGPGDWDGARISESGGAQIEAALRALGADPRYDSPTVTESTDTLDGIETHVAAVRARERPRPCASRRPRGQPHPNTGMPRCHGRRQGR